MKTAGPPYRYLILGAGRQGTAAAYDLVRFGQAAEVVLADLDFERAQAAAERVNQLTGQGNCRPLSVDVADQDAVRQAMQPAHVVLSAVPYQFNLALTRLAIEGSAHLCDLGGNTAIVMQQIDMGDEARRAEVSLVPDCGMGPGLINNLAVYAMEQLDEPQEVFIYDGGLPQDPEPPWNYALTFHVNGLTNEMDGEAVFIRQGQIQRVPTLTEREVVQLPTLGLMEADITSGGTSTAPYTFQGRLRTYENKTVRFPGHFEWLKAFKTLGLFSEDPVEVDGQPVVPRNLYHALLEPKLQRMGVIEDIGVIRIIAKGKKAGEEATAIVDLEDRYDPETGFTAMERLTGWHASIVMIAQAQGQVSSGARPVEVALPASQVVQELERRGIQTNVSVD